MLYRQCQIEQIGGKAEEDRCIAADGFKEDRKDNVIGDWR
jgi:hypothetical protein